MSLSMSTDLLSRCTKNLKNGRNTKFRFCLNWISVEKEHFREDFWKTKLKHRRRTVADFFVEI